MPHKKTLGLPDWVEKLDDTCLYQTVVEALVARQFAMSQGAQEHKACKAALHSADATLEQIASGRVTGTAACRKAADSLRKYNTAGECAHPTASR